mmetsp:Transcript_51592/g.160069  ORF Transcript_51592/g.160069 Transcript_51592/m.160069 type:complete len:366 (-) Transcript_51592:770-1867(-)
MGQSSHSKTSVGVNLSLPGASGDCAGVPEPAAEAQEAVPAGGNGIEEMAGVELDEAAAAPGVAASAVGRRRFFLLLACWPAGWASNSSSSSAASAPGGGGGAGADVGDGKPAGAGAGAARQQQEPGDLADGVPGPVGLRGLSPPPLAGRGHVQPQGGLLEPVAALRPVGALHGGGRGVRQAQGPGRRLAGRGAPDRGQAEAGTGAGPDLLEAGDPLPRGGGRRRGAGDAAPRSRAAEAALVVDAVGAAAQAAEEAARIPEEGDAGKVLEGTRATGGSRALARRRRPCGRARRLSRRPRPTDDAAVHRSHALSRPSSPNEGAAVRRSQLAPPPILALEAHVKRLLPKVLREHWVGELRDDVAMPGP